MTLARTFVDWAWTQSESGVPAQVRDQVALHVLDGLGNALAGARLNNAPFAVPVALSLGRSDEATVLGSPERASAGSAALANGILLHTLDYDDTHTQGLVHATAMTLPAALAVGERERVSGTELVHAMAIGYELAGRLSRAVPHGFHAKGMHATAVCGTFTSALVAALLSRLSPDEAVNALGIAGSQSGGTMEFLATGAATKQIHPGWVGLAGVVAAALAAAGATGPDTILEGEHGLYALFSAVPPDLGSVVAGLGDSWQVEQVEVKLYPACHLMHRSLDVAEALGRVVEVNAIRDVLLRVPDDSIPIVCAPAEVKQRPRTAYEAKFSAQWSVAAMLVDGRVGIDSYQTDRIGRPDVARLAQLVRYEPTGMPEPAAEQPGSITVTTADGAAITLRSDDAAFGAPDAPLGDRIIAKFRANVAATDDVTDELLAATLALPAAPSLDRLADALRAVASDWTDRPAGPVLQEQWS
jgi:2-methylcitrate dehydratase PrpD